jgi:hypothetical protein
MEKRHMGKVAVEMDGSTSGVDWDFIHSRDELANERCRASCFPVFRKSYPLALTLRHLSSGGVEIVGSAGKSRYDMLTCYSSQKPSLNAVPKRQLRHKM